MPRAKGWPDAGNELKRVAAEIRPGEKRELDRIDKEITEYQRIVKALSARRRHIIRVVYQRSYQRDYNLRKREKDQS